MKKLSFILGAGIVILIPYFVHAEPILRSGESISIDAEQLLDGDFYGLAQKISISGKATNDVYLGGMNVVLNADVQEDLTVVGGTIQIHGEVGDDIRILGGDITLGERVGGDVVVYGGALTILSTAYIEGDLIYYGEDLSVEGDVRGSIHGSSQKVRIDSKVGGDIQYTVTGTMLLGENAEISGSVSYKSENTLARSEKTIVQGKIYKKNITPEQPSSIFGSYLFLLGILIFTSLILYFLNKHHVRSFITSSVSMFGQNGLIGIGILLLIPFVSFILIVSVVGMFAGLILMFMYLSALIVSVALAGILFGFYVQKIVTKKKNINIQTIIIGSIVLTALTSIPYIGIFTIFAMVIIALGNLGRQLYNLIRS